MKKEGYPTDLEGSEMNSIKNFGELGIDNMGGYEDELFNQQSINNENEFFIKRHETKQEKRDRLKNIGRFGEKLENTQIDIYDFLPNQKWMILFPEKIEKFFYRFDDFFLNLFQRRASKIFAQICKFITFCTTVEFIIALPFFLFGIGIDGLAIEMTYLAIITAIISQVPKRFVWRWRPWMRGRAKLMVRTDTSSFPSRAVCCAVVYSYAICYSYMYFFGAGFEWWMPFLFIITFFLSSFARIYLGVHYPSDCLFGALEGVIICLLGVLFWGADVWGCTSCHDDKCYAEYGSSNQLEVGALIGNMSFWPFLIAIIASLGISVSAIIKPLRFWAKSDRVLGILLPCVVFQVGFLCPNASKTDSSLSEPLFPPPYYSYAFSFIIPAVILVVCQKAKFQKNLLVFILVFSSLLTMLILWRLFVLPYQGAS